jgi:hypothetical protein
VAVRSAYLEAFKQAFNETVMRILSMQEKAKAA